MLCMLQIVAGLCFVRNILSLLAAQNLHYESMSEVIVFWTAHL